MKNCPLSGASYCCNDTKLMGIHITAWCVKGIMLFTTQGSVCAACPSQTQIPDLKALVATSHAELKEE